MRSCPAASILSPRAYLFSPFHKESSPILEHQSKKLPLNPTRWAVAPFDVEVQNAVGTAKKENSYVPLSVFADVKMGRKMVIGIEPQPQPLDLYAANLAQPVLFPWTTLSTTGHKYKICEPMMAAPQLANFDVPAMPAVRVATPVFT